MNNTVTAHSSSQRIVYALAFVVFTILFLYHINPIGLGDMYWHLNTGRWIWEHGKLPDSDPFSYTQVDIVAPGQDYTSKNYWQILILKGFWLAQILYFGTYAVFGIWGLVILKAALFLALYVLVWRTMIKSNVDPLLGLLSILLFPWLIYRYDELRPHVFSFIGVVLVYMNMSTALTKLKSGNTLPGSLVALPIIMILWANLHPGFMLGWVIITIMLAGAVFDRWRGINALEFPQLRRLFIWCGIALLVSLANPLADVLKSYLGIVGGQFAFGIDEHLPLFTYAKLYSQPFLFYGVLSISLVVLGALIWRRKHIDPAQVVLIAGFAAVGYYAFRYMIFFVLMAFMIGMPHISAISERYLPKFRPILYVLLLFAISGVGYQAFRFGAWMQGPVQTYFVPERAADFVLDKHPPGPLFNAYEYGGYLGWRLTPEYRIFVDPRCLDINVHNDYQTARGGHYHGVFERYGVNSVVFYIFTPLVNSIPEVTLYLLMDRQWDLVFVDKLSVVLVRHDRNELPKIDKAPLLDYLQRVLERTLLATPNDTQAIVEYGRIMLFRGNIDGARQYFIRALQINPQLLAPRSYLKALTPQKN